MARTPARRTLIAGLGLAALGATTIAAVPVLSRPGAPEAPETEPSEPAGEEPLIGRPDAEQIHVMSFNIRLDLSTAPAAEALGLTVTEPGDADHWPDRRPLVTALLRREQPTLLGVQEARFPQLSAIQEALPRHRHVGYGRHGGSQDEHSALFYDADRFELLAWDQFWLSDTPEVIGSATWGHEISRLVVWARLRDRDTGAELAALNTHFDHRSETARRRSAEAVDELITTGDLAGLPLVVTGDFNAVAGDSAAYSVLVGDGPLQDSWEVAEERLTPAWGTFPDYEDPVEGARRIDWVLISEGITAHRAAIDARRDQGGRFPSDHAPVQVLLSLP